MERRELLTFGQAMRWHDAFGENGEALRVADINGDGRDDLLSFGQGGRGKVWISPSNGFGFGPTQLVREGFSVRGEEPAVGDVNGDGRADIITFRKSAHGDGRDGDVLVALSNGSSFGPSQKWHGTFGYGGEILKVADVNGDGRDDLLSFVQASGTVFVSLSTGSRFGAARLWREGFSPRGEEPAVGDVNGDGRADIISFTKNAYYGGLNGDVRVALSTGSRFASALTWHYNFGYQGEILKVADVNGDGRDDLVCFVQASGTVFVSLSTGSRFGTTQGWHPRFAFWPEEPAVGDANGDGRSDILTFTKGTTNDVWVALAQPNSLAGRAASRAIGGTSEVASPAFNGSAGNRVDPITTSTPTRSGVIAIGGVFDPQGTSVAYSGPGRNIPLVPTEDGTSGPSVPTRRLGARIRG